MSRRLAVVGVFLGALQLQCADGTFECQTDDQCSGGTCSADGWCAFPDDDCPSGLRYGAHAGGGLAGDCVPDGGTDGGSTGPDDPPTTNQPATTNAPVTTDDPSSTGQTTDDTTGDTEAPPGVCGDTIQDSGEACDDGNDVPGDGCDPDCTLSGEVLWSTEIDGGGDDAFRDVAVLGDDIAVAGDFDEKPQWFVYDTDGNETAAHDVDFPSDGHAWGLATLDATVVIGGTTTGGTGFVVVQDARGAAASAFETQEEVFDVAVTFGGEQTLWTCGALGGQPIAMEYDYLGSTVTEVLPDPLPVSGTAWDILVDGVDLYIVGEGGDQDDPLPWIHGLAITGEPQWTADLDAMAVAGAAYGAALTEEFLVVSGSIQDRLQNRGVIAVFERSTGTPRWGTDVDADDGEFASVHKVAAGPSGEIVGVGRLAVSESDADIWVGKYDAEGQLVWEQTFAGDGDLDSSGYGVVVHDDGSITAVGSSHNADFDAWIVHLEP